MTIIRVLTVKLAAVAALLAIGVFAAPEARADSKDWGISVYGGDPYYGGYSITYRDDDDYYRRPYYRDSYYYAPAPRYYYRSSYRPSYRPYYRPAYRAYYYDGPRRHYRHYDRYDRRHRRW